MLGLGRSFTRSAHRVDPASATRLVREGALLLDVRTPSEFDTGAPSGALNIPVQELSARLHELPRDRAIVAYCRSGVRSATAVAQLVAAGFDAWDAGGLSNVM